MAEKFVFANAQIITPSEVISGSVSVENGQIADVQQGASSIPGAVQFDGDYLLPGLVDVHTDHFEQLAKPRKSVNWPVRQALLAHDAHMAAVGITTIFDSMYVGHYGEDSRGDVVLKQVVNWLGSAWARQAFRGEHFVHLRAEVPMDHLIPIFDEVFPNSLVKLVSVMDHTPGQRQWRDLEQYRIMEKRDYHHTDEKIDAFLQECFERQERNYASNRKKLVERVSSHSVTLASHDDTTAEHVHECHAEGIAISEFPTTMEAAKEARARGMKIVAGSPNLVLGGSHSGNVAVADLAREGTLDALASDYVPSSLLEGAFLLHKEIGMALPAAIATVTVNPARMTGLEDRGSIEPGKRADFVRVKMVDGTPVPVMVWRHGQRIA